MFLFIWVSDFFPNLCAKDYIFKAKMYRGRVGQTWEEATLVFLPSLFPRNVKTHCLCLTDGIQNPRAFVDAFEEVLLARRIPDLLGSYTRSE